MSKPRLGTLCTGPVYIFDCEVEDFHAEQPLDSRKHKGKEPKPNRAAGERSRKSRKPSR